MNVPAYRGLAFATLLFWVGVIVPARVLAQDCGDSPPPDSGGDPSQNDVINPGGGAADQGGNPDISDFADMNNQNWDNMMTAWNFFAQSNSDGSSGSLILVAVNTTPTVYAGSPTPVSSDAWFFSGLPYSHSIEYINADGSSGGVWTTSIDYPVYGGPYYRSINVTFPTPGTYYVRAGGTVSDGQATYPWFYSDQQTVTVLDPITNYMVSIQTFPKPGMEKWILPSRQVTKPFQVFHSN